MRVRGGLQPSRVGGAVNPLAHVEAGRGGAALARRGDRALRAGARRWRSSQEIPPLRSRWKRMFDKSGAAARGALRGAPGVARGRRELSAHALHLKLFCDGGELYLDLDVRAEARGHRREGSRVPARACGARCRRCSVPSGVTLLPFEVRWARRIGRALVPAGRARRRRGRRRPRRALRRGVRDLARGTRRSPCARRCG